MTKLEFLTQLESGLGVLTESDAQERLNFYSEMIDDRVEEGLSEEQAVAQIGDVNEIIASILAEIPQRAAPKQPVIVTPKPEPKVIAAPQKEKKGIRAWQIVMLIVGAPLWIPLLAAALVIVLALLAVLWSVVVCMWAVFAALAGIGAGGVISGIATTVSGNLPIALQLLGMGLAGAGLAIFAFHGCLALTKGSAYLTKIVCKGIFRLFFGRRNAQ